MHRMVRECGLHKKQGAGDRPSERIGAVKVLTLRVCARGIGGRLNEVVLQAFQGEQGRDPLVGGHTSGRELLALAPARLDLAAQGVACSCGLDE
ncbi:hypothetical protein ACFYZB_33675 [Streptomyces sp. NPDC001852]|uniref:hypothetical protein n=1 Tax=Streptomyces sp. NPDC001852 TaxID=3364619 RepID=UPI0036B9994F